MRKIPTMFVRDPADMSRVTREVSPGCEAAARGDLCATEKIDGTAVMWRDRLWWKRRTVRADRAAPKGFVPAQDQTTDTGKLLGWVPVGRQIEDQWHWEAAATLDRDPLDGCTFELVGPKINGNPYGLSSHALVRHGERIIRNPDTSFDGIHAYLAAHEIEGMVFWDLAPVCKIKRRDFGIEWPARRKGDDA